MYRLLPVRKIKNFSLIVTSCLFFLNLNLSAQYSVLNSLFPQESGNGSFYFDLAFNQKLYGSLLEGGSGLSVDLGWNIGGHINDKIVLAPYVGLSPRWGVNYSTDFLSYTQNNYSNDALSNADESASRDFQDILAGNVDSELSLYYGLILRPPFRYFPITKIYATFLTSSAKGEKSGTVYYTDGTTRAEYSSIGHIFRSGYGIEAMLFRTKQIIAEGKKRTGMSLHLGYISIYAEQYKEYTIGDYDSKVPLKDFFTVPADFESKHGKELSVGLKVGICFL